MDPIVVKDDWDTTPSLSPLNSDDLALDDDDDSSAPSFEDLPRREDLYPLPVHKEERDPKLQPPFTGQHTQLLDDLSSRQYWQKDWASDINSSRPFDLSDPSTLGPSIENARSLPTRRSYPSRSPSSQACHTNVCIAHY